MSSASTLSWFLRATPRLCRTGLQNAAITTIAPRREANILNNIHHQRPISTTTKGSAQAQAQTISSVSYDAHSHHHAAQPVESDAEAFITSHPLVKSLRADPSFTESRPHLTMPASLKPHHLVAGVLSGPGKVTVPPFLFSAPDSRQVVSLFHLGPELCGHPGFVHGGVLTVLFDEVFARTAMPYLPSKLGVTANLSVDYRAPAAPDAWYALKARVVGLEGRKAWVEGRLESLPMDPATEPVLVAEGKSLFVEPKFAKSMPSLYKS
ncbi:hypothetical protein VTN02DRAFT_1209 [Thermoascus thermophilus]